MPDLFIHRLQAQYVYPGAAFGGTTQLLSLPHHQAAAATHSPALAAALAASGNGLSHLFDYHQAAAAAGQLGAGGATTVGAATQGNGMTASHFQQFAAAQAAQASAAAFDPYASSAYLAAVSAAQPHVATTQHHATYAAYLPQMAASGLPGTATTAATAAGLPISQYAVQDGRIQ